MPTPQGRRHRVFIIDDNDVIRRLLSSIVRQDDRFEYVGQAPTGGAALEALKKTPADLLCLDVHMPDMDGISLLAQLKDQGSEARVVMISGYATSEVVRKSRELGAAGFIVKPFTAARVLATLHEAIASS